MNWPDLGPNWIPQDLIPDEDTCEEYTGGHACPECDEEDDLEVDIYDAKCVCGWEGEEEEARTYVER
tara:strand:- start:496 stop:696 length:201 start_codon:yes stop_codon:yes gene_type:complete